jgi:coenzyme F420-0:L-glutamate ligase/coenzyme F420-1:gamma-L-glutamate ligase
MNTSYSAHGLKTGLIRPGDDLAEEILHAALAIGGLQDGDIIVIAENAVATAEGSVVRLEEIEPSREARELAQSYDIDPRLAEIVLGESDSVVGGIPGFLLCMKNGTLLPNAGVDGSNAPPGAVVLLPGDPDTSAENLRRRIGDLPGVRIGVIIADSRTHAMRLGCGGVAIGCSGIEAVTDERGRRDLYGRQLEVTKRAVADNIASAAELIMGEADECIPAAVLRGLQLPIGDQKGVESIEASECLFMGVALNTNPAMFDGQRKAEPE